MEDLEKICLSPETPVIKAIEVITYGYVRTALVVDSHKKLLGVVADGDIRRGILNGVDFNEPVTKVMHAQPTTAKPSDSREQILKQMHKLGVFQMPVVDEQGRVVRLELLDQLVLPKKHNNTVVLMAGGQGTRLRPLTKKLPKPMIKVGEKPIIETIINNFSKQGFDNFYISVNYMADVIKDYLKDGSDLDVTINYLEEDTPLGTAGALSMLPPQKDPIIVMNGDLLSKVDFSKLINHHNQKGVLATMCVRKYMNNIPYGVIDFDEDFFIHRLEEKPERIHFVNAGIYALSPEVLSTIPKTGGYDMTQIFEQLVAEKKPAAAFPVKDYWVDIGQHEDLQQAVSDYSEFFGPN